MNDNADMPMDDATSPHDVELYLLRHAHAGNPAEWTSDDAKRPLSAKGRRQSERLGQFLAERGFKPNAIVTSPKLRASETAEIVASALEMTVETDDRLGGRLDLDVLATILEDAGVSRVMLVGHDPDFSDLAATLIGAAYLPLKKCALARFDLPMPVQASTGILRWLVPPGLIG